MSRYHFVCHFQQVEASDALKHFTTHEKRQRNIPQGINSGKVGKSALLSLTLKSKGILQGSLFPLHSLAANSSSHRDLAVSQQAKFHEAQLQSNHFHFKSLCEIQTLQPGIQSLHAFSTVYFPNLFLISSLPIGYIQNIEKTHYSPYTIPVFQPSYVCSHKGSSFLHVKTPHFSKPKSNVTLPDLIPSHRSNASLTNTFAAFHLSLCFLPCLKVSWA